ncbi:LIC_13387 family protein [Lysobacter antibioticus]|uniref:LIC_13387 family protein n=1 Tax=Lysobacter antibioticus TaxID=84531 RepID=UPI0007164991|nr:hypothetical protein [Lysobacter antibioticus]
MLASWLVVASAVVCAYVGVVHLLYTLFGSKLNPRDAQLMAAMKQGSLVVSAQTNVWRAWIGFNASHSLGFLLFSAVFGHLALSYPALLFGSVYLAAAGAAFLAALVVAARRYFFRAPFVVLIVALVLYLAGIVAAHL